MTLRNKFNSEKATFNVSGTQSFLLLDGNYAPEDYEVTVSAYTASHMSEETKLTVDMARMSEYS